VCVACALPLVARKGTCKEQNKEGMKGLASGSKPYKPYTEKANDFHEPYYDLHRSEVLSSPKS
jgi:hypothetical protein